MSTGKIFMNLVEDTYKMALVSKQQWTSFLKRLKWLLGAENITIFSKDLDVPGGSIVVSSELGPYPLQLFDDYYKTVNVMTRHVHSIWQGQFLFGKEHTLDAAPPDTRDENDSSARLQTYYWSGSILKLKHRTAEVIMMVRNSEKGPLDHEKLSLFRMLLPHIERACQLQDQLSMTDSYKSALAQMIETLPYGVLFVDEKARAIEMNQAAHEIIAQNDGIALGKNRKLVVDCSELRAKMDEVLSTVTSSNTRAGAKSSAGTLLAIPRPSGKRSYTVHITGMTLPDDTVPSSSPAVAVFLSDPEKHPTPLSATLKARYGLTRSEANLAQLLFQGKELRDAARELFVSMNTVRSHLKQIFSKTDTHRQGELIALLNRLPTSTMVLQN